MEQEEEEWLAEHDRNKRREGQSARGKERDEDLLASQIPNRPPDRRRYMQAERDRQESERMGYKDQQ